MGQKVAGLDAIEKSSSLFLGLGFTFHGRNLSQNDDEAQETVHLYLFGRFIRF